MMIGSTVEYLAANNENRLLRVAPASNKDSPKRTQPKSNVAGLVKKQPIQQPLKQASLISTSSSDTSVSNESTTSASSTSSILPHPNFADPRRIYAGLNDVDEQLFKPLSIDFFFNDDYMTENACLGLFQTQAQQSSLPPGKPTTNTISPKTISVKPTTSSSSNRVISESIDWNDGLNEWQSSHPYPSFKSYLSNLGKRRPRLGLGEFDEASGLFLLPLSNPTSKQPAQRENSQQLTTQNKNPANRYQSKSQSMNLLNNQLASQRLFRELNKLASTTTPSPPSTSTPTATPNETSPLLTGLTIKIDGASSKKTTSNSQQLKTSSSCLLLQPVSESSTSLLKKTASWSSASSVVESQINRAPGPGRYQLAEISRRRFSSSDTGETINASQRPALDDIQETSNGHGNIDYLGQEIQSGPNIVDEFNLSSPSKVFKVQAEFSNQKNQETKPPKTSENEFGSESLLVQPVTTDLAAINTQSAFGSSNQLFFINNSFTYNNGRTNPPAARIAKVTKPNFNMTKQFLLTNNSGNSGPRPAQGQPIESLNGGQYSNLDAGSLQSNVTSLPPILAGKRINLPLGPHRYAQYHRPNKAHLYKFDEI